MPDNESLHEALRAAEPTPIAQLSPDLSDQTTRAVDGAVTITWPFSIVTKSIAFIVAERDFRLRREKGQIRIRFHGAAAKAITDASVGGGDEVRLGLVGARWEKNESNTQLAGSTLEWQLEYTNRLVLIIRGIDSQERVVDVDVSDTDAETANGQADTMTSLDESHTTSNLEIPPTDLSDILSSAKRPAPASFETQEFASPAFIKRARVSYGSLFEGGLDIFDEDVGRKGKTKRKSRFSLPATTWRYSSRSPSPEDESEPEPETGESTRVNGVDSGAGKEGRVDKRPQATEDVPMNTPPRPVMVDEGCQTMEVDFTPMHSVQVSAEARSTFAFPYATPTPLPRTKPIDPEDVVLDHSLQLQVDPVEGEPGAGEVPAGFLGQSAHGDNGLTFGFATSQPIIYPTVPNIFSAPRSDESLHESIHDIPVSENYPASFLDNSTLATPAVDTHPSLSPNDSPAPTEPHPSEQVGTPFQNDAQFYSPYHAASQPPPSAWATVPSAALSSADASNVMDNDVENDMENDINNDLDNPVEIMSSSPVRDRDASEDIPSSPSERTGLTSVPPHFRRQPYAAHAMPDTLLEEDENAIGQEESADEASEEEQYQDGGDEPGDDYDLRNYDRAHDDDDDADGSEEDQDPSPDDPDAQAINPEEEELEEEELEEEEDDDDDAEVAVEQEYESDEEMDPTRAVGSNDDQDEDDGQDEEMEGDVTGEYYSDEGSYEGDELAGGEEYDEDEEEDDEDEEVAHPQASADPVVIDLISDSEDENEVEPEPTKEPEPTDEPEKPQETDQKSEADEAPKTPAELEQPTASKDTAAESIPEDSAKSSEPKPLDDVPQTVQDAKSEPTASEDANVAPPDEMEIDAQPTEPSTAASITKDVNLAEADDQESEKDDIIQTLSRQTPSPESAEKDQTHELVEEHESPTKSPDVDMGATNVPTEESENEIKEKGIAQQVEDAGATTTAPTKSPDAMDVDETEDVGEAEIDDSTATADKKAVDTNDGVKEVENAITEDSSAANEGQGDVNEASASGTPGNGVQPLPMSNAPAQEIEPSQGEPESTQEAQGQGRAESPDTTMQDASHVETATETRSWQAINMPETGTGEVGVEASKSQQLVPDGQMSPPATQASHSQPLREVGEPTLSQATSTLSNLEHDHLPTPGETQTDEAEMAENYHLTDHGNGQIDEDDLNPEDQIMAEIQQHSPTKPSTPSPHAHPATSSPAASPEPQDALTEASVELVSTDTIQASDALITVKSLRSRGHGSAKSKSSDISLVDPNLSLAKSPTSPTPKTLRITRSKSDQVDPSIKLARASTHAAGPKGKGRESDVIDEADNSPPAKLRVSRNRADHIDPSIQLAKGPASSTRQSRRLVTPESKHELSASFRGPAQKASTPDTAVSAPLQSPSVAGSSAAPEDENVGTVKLQLLKSLRTGLPDCTSLKMLRNSLNQSTDIIAVATTTPALPHRPKHGPRDYMLTLSLTDPSVAPTGVSVAHIFRPHQASLPVVHAGDVVLLRRMQVASMKGRGFGVRAGDASAWAVFEKGDEELLPQIKGPQVEVTENELRYVEGLRRWWGLLDDKSMEKMERASRKVSEAGKEDVK